MENDKKQKLNAMLTEMAKLSESELSFLEGVVITLNGINKAV